MLRGAIGIAAFLVLAEIAGRLGLISDALPLTSEIVARAVTLMPKEARYRVAQGPTPTSCPPSGRR